MRMNRFDHAGKQSPGARFCKLWQDSMGLFEPVSARQRNLVQLVGLDIALLLDRTGAVSFMPSATLPMAGVSIPTGVMYPQGPCLDQPPSTRTLAEASPRLARCRVDLEPERTGAITRKGRCRRPSRTSTRQRQRAINADQVSRLRLLRAWAASDSSASRSVQPALSPPVIDAIFASNAWISLCSTWGKVSLIWFSLSRMPCAESRSFSAR